MHYLPRYALRETESNIFNLVASVCSLWNEVPVQCVIRYKIHLVKTQ